MIKSLAGLSLTLALGPLAASAQAAAAAEATPTAELARCAALSAASERLACYDALSCADIASPEERLACFDAIAKGKSPRAQPAPAAARVAAATAAADPATASVAAPASADLSRFGLEKSVVPVAPGPGKIQARVTQVSTDLHGNVSLRLDNGQTWSVQQPDLWLHSGDTVTIRKAALGSYLLTTPAHHSYRVRRLE